MTQEQLKEGCEISDEINNFKHALSALVSMNDYHGHSVNSCFLTKKVKDLMIHELTNELTRLNTKFEQL
jgi:hypothetical protein